MLETPCFLDDIGLKRTALIFLIFLFLSYDRKLSRIRHFEYRLQKVSGTGQTGVRFYRPFECG